MKSRLPFNSYLLLLILFTVFVSCKRNDKPPAPLNDFFYYPARNIYYDSAGSVYYYSLDSAKTWDSLVIKGQEHPDLAGIKIPLPRPAGNVWEQNELHRKTYNGRLINVVNSHSILLGRIDSMNKVKPIVVVKYKPVEPTPAIEEKPPPEKGIKKFFNRLFGKKKKKEQQ